MAALTDAMKWYKLSEPGLSTAPRLKYHFQVRFYTAYYQQELGDLSKLLFEAVRSIELPKFSIETEIANSWNLRQPIPTKINFEPISITFTDTHDNLFQNFIQGYMNVISGSFVESPGGTRKGFDQFGLKLLESGKDSPINKIEIIKFYGANPERTEFDDYSKVTLWRPKIVDVQNDSLDYSISEAVTWTISVRYESVTYEDGKNGS